MRNEKRQRKWNRREFAKSALGSAAVASSSHQAFAKLVLPDLNESVGAPRIHQASRPILAWFDDDALAAAVKECAKKLGCGVYWAEDPSDLIAAPFFLGIVDRTCLGAKGWQDYLDYLDICYDGKKIIVDGEVVHEGKGQESPLILLDAENSFPEPKPSTRYHSSLRLYRCSPEDPSEIALIIEAEHAKVQAEKLREK